MESSAMMSRFESPRQDLAGWHKHDARTQLRAASNSSCATAKWSNHNPVKK